MVRREGGGVWRRGRGPDGGIGRRARTRTRAAGAVLWVVGLAAAAGGSAWVADGMGAGVPLRLNWSPSLRRGLYRVVRLAPGEAVRPGELVLACPPAGFAALALERGYLPRGRCAGGTQALGKVVLAVAGDRVEVGAAGIVVDGQALAGTGVLAADSRGRRLPRVAGGAHRVAAGEVWLVAAHPRSLDSRYFGAVRRAAVAGRLVPVMTATGAGPEALAAAVRRAHGG